MQVDGLGERPVVDTGGFPVVWLGYAGCTIGQDPNQGGTNCYGPGDVLVDAETGATYQIGGDWHLRQLGAGDSQSAPPPQQAPSVVDHFYYVDSGEIIEKTTYTDGSAAYSDTGMQSPLSNGTAANDPYSLQQTQPAQGSPDGSGFQATNPAGGYGPYLTPDPPRLTDLGTYVDSGRLIDHQVDQYGNDYYTDVGPAPTSPPMLAPPINQRPAPSVPTPRVTAPSVGPGTPPRVTTPAPAEPVAIDGQKLSGQPAATQAIYQSLYGQNAASTWVAQHNAALGATKSVTAPSAPSVGPSGVQAPGTARPGAPTPAISATGDPTQWLHQAVNWFSRASFVSGVPNGALVLGGYVGYSMLRRRRR